VEESCTIGSSRARWPVRKILDAPSYIHNFEFVGKFNYKFSA